MPQSMATGGTGPSSQVHLIVVGAGPAGAFAAIAAAQKGFQVTLLEAGEEIDSSPRAATFHPSTLEMVDGVGVMDDLARIGLLARYFDFWDKPSLSLIARFDHEVLRGDTKFPFVLQVEQHKFVHVLLQRLEEYPNVVVRRGVRVVALTQSEDGVTVLGDGTHGGTELTGDWLIGADGARSTVRTVLGIDFEGYTWPERFLVLTTTFDFEAALGCSYRSYFAGPSDWANVFKIAGDDLKGRWRVVSATKPDESDAEALGDASCARRLHALSPDADVEQVEHRNLYKVHQRVAARFRAGRAFLVGDAAHVNNPIGGLGLNCGVHDVRELIDVLALARDSGCSSTIDAYEPRRRDVNIRYVQDQTVENKRRLEERSPESRAERHAELRRMAGGASSQREFLLRTSLLASLERPSGPTPRAQDEQGEQAELRSRAPADPNVIATQNG